MATPDDIWHEIGAIALHQAKYIDELPTGVKPGYSPRLGGTVRPNGRVQYVSEESSGLFHWASMTGDDQSVAAFTPTQLAFDLSTTVRGSDLSVHVVSASNVGVIPYGLGLLDAIYTVTATVEWDGADTGKRTLYLVTDNVIGVSAPATFASTDMDMVSGIYTQTVTGLGFDTDGGIYFAVYVASDTTTTIAAGCRVRVALTGAQ